MHPDVRRRSDGELLLGAKRDDANRPPAPAAVQETRELEDADDPRGVVVRAGRGRLRVVMRANVEDLGAEVGAGQVDDDILRRAWRHPSHDPAASLGGALPHPVPGVLMGDVQRGHGANPRGVGGEHAVRQGRRAWVARVHHEQKGGSSGHEALVGLARLDVAAEVDHRLSAQLLEIVPLIVGRRDHGDLSGPPGAVRARCVAEERARETAPCPAHQDLEAFFGDDARLDGEGFFPGLCADLAGTRDDVVRGGSLTGGASQPDADVLRKHVEISGEPFGRGLQHGRQHSAGAVRLTRLFREGVPDSQRQRRRVRVRHV